MKKLFGLLALSTIISFTATAAASSLTHNGNETASTLGIAAEAIPNMIDSEAAEFDAKLTGQASPHSYFMIDTQDTKGEEGIEARLDRLGAAAIRDMRIDAAMHIQNIIAATPAAEDIHLAGRKADIQHQAADIEQIVAGEGGSIEGVLSRLIATYQARTKGREGANENFYNGLKQQGEALKSTLSRTTTGTKSRMADVAGSARDFGTRIVQVSGGRK